MAKQVDCPICKSKWGTCKDLGPSKEKESDFNIFECEICGKYELAGLLNTTIFTTSNQVSDLLRAVISHRARQNYEENKKSIKINNEWFEAVSKSAKLPTRAHQALNVIRYIGDRVTQEGKAIAVATSLYSLFGCFDPPSAKRLLQELQYRSVLSHDNEILSDTEYSEIEWFGDVDLTLEGWEKYEKEKQGQLNGSYAFIAMEFGDKPLEDFVKNHIKPVIFQELGYELFDLREKSQAGIIDNIMRIQIRDAKFVLVDLTHDNKGAYWEAGYAEGLGKPVIYICEKNKFDKEKTHFDTNHCTTELWANESEEELLDFKKRLVAMIRRSIGI